MLRRFQTILLIALALWAVNSTEAAAQKKSSPVFAHVHALAMDAGGQTLFLGAHTGLFRSDNEGRSWNKVPLITKHAHLDVMDIAPDPKDPKTIYVATHETAVFKSTDGGKT
ncbi:MAG: hypothetical protein OEN50_18605, partial [Deltaproteobacteria bacterium]|nr:hypothetical protein [Deltaproteobacteria bacterium]